MCVVTTNAPLPETQSPLAPATLTQTFFPPIYFTTDTGAQATITTSTTSITIDLSANSYSKYEVRCCGWLLLLFLLPSPQLKLSLLSSQVYIAQWQLDGSEATPLPSYNPHTLTTDTLTANGLQAGRYFQVRWRAQRSLSVALAFCSYHFTRDAHPSVVSFTVIHRSQ